MVNKIALDNFIVFYIINVMTLNIGFCQHMGRHFDATRFREESRGIYSPIRQSISGRSFNNRLADPSYRGHFSGQSGFRNSEHVSYPQVANTDRNFGIPGRNKQSFGADQTRYTTADRGADRVYQQNPHVVPFNGQNEQIQYLQPERVDARTSDRASDSQGFPYRRDLTFTERSMPRDGHTPLRQGRLDTLRRNVDATQITPQLWNRRPEVPFSYQLRADRQIYPSAPAFNENLNPYQLRSAITASRSTPQTIRNEVFQYRTSVRRTPKYDSFPSGRTVDQQRFSGNPVQSLALPFEPLSLRYQGFRESKIARQQRRMSDRAAGGNAGNTETTPVQTNRQFETRPGQSHIAAPLNNGNMNEAVYTTRSRHDPSPFQTNVVSRNMDRNTEAPQREIPFRRGLPTTSSSPRMFPDRNTARNNNIRPSSPQTQPRRVYDKTTNSDERPIGWNGQYRNILTGAGFQRGVGHTRGASVNNGVFRNSPQSDNRRRFLQNSAHRRRNTPGKSFRDMLGISRAGLETALKTDVPHDKKPVQSRNSLPISNPSQGLSSSRQSGQRAGPSNHDISTNAVISDQSDDKANLITDIQRNMDIVDRLNRLRNLLARNNLRTNRLSFGQVSDDNMDEDDFNNVNNNDISFGRTAGSNVDSVIPNIHQIGMLRQTFRNDEDDN